MPPRRRAGYRPTKLDKELRAALKAEEARLEAIGDPVSVIRATNDTFAGLDDALAEVAVPRLRAVMRLRAAGWAMQKIADETGVSKPRIQQLSAEAKRRGIS